MENNICDNIRAIEAKLIEISCVPTGIEWALLKYKKLPQCQKNIVDEVVNGVFTDFEKAFLFTSTILNMMHKPKCEEKYKDIDPKYYFIILAIKRTIRKLNTIQSCGKMVKIFRSFNAMKLDRQIVVLEEVNSALSEYAKSNILWIAYLFLTAVESEDIRSGKDSRGYRIYRSF